MRVVVVEMGNFEDLLVWGGMSYEGNLRSSNRYLVRLRGASSFCLVPLLLSTVRACVLAYRSPPLSRREIPDFLGLPMCLLREQRHRFNLSSWFAAACYTFPPPHQCPHPLNITLCPLLLYHLTGTPTAPGRAVISTPDKIV